MLCVHKAMHTAETKGGRHNTVVTGIQIKISTEIRGLSKDSDPDPDSGSFGKMPKKPEWCIVDPGATSSISSDPVSNLGPYPIPKLRQSQVYLRHNS
jgi:hypothetical protein